MEYVSINGTKLRAAISGKSPAGMTLSSISTEVLHKSENYLTTNLQRNQLKKEYYDTLCALFRLNPEAYIFEENLVDEEKTDSTAVVLTNIYKVMNEIKEETKNQNALLIQGIKILGEINKNLNQNTEKVKAIFTEVKYNK